MEEALGIYAHFVALACEAIAITAIGFGVLEAVVQVVRAVANRAETGHDRRAVWLQFARWLVAGLTFQLAADIVSTSFAPTWEEVGKLGAIAVIRTFLSYFLDRDIDDTRKRQREVPLP
jgi:uncharacterized membrane protein